MNFLKKLFHNILREKPNRPVFLIDESSVEIDTNIENILAYKTENEKEPITTTVAFQLLFQATADVINARKEGIESGIIAEEMTQDQAIAYLYAQYIFLGFEKKISPMLVGSLARIYCTDNFFSEFSFYYQAIANNQGFKIEPSIFHNTTMYPTMNISETAKQMKLLGYKKHCIPPFKEPYKGEWLNNN